jgi:hypothetical protein
MLVASLWWVARLKAVRKTHLVRLAAAVLLLLIVADVVQENRSGEEDPQHKFSVVKLITEQGISLNVTQVVLKYTYLFSPYFASYMGTELQNAFIANDVSTNRRGRSMANDVSMFLNAPEYGLGHGTAGSYVAEAYLGGGIVLLIFVSVALSLGLHLFYCFSSNAKLLFLFAISLPDILLMPKGQLLDWVSILFRDAVAIGLLWFGWKLYSLLLSIRRTATSSSEPDIVTA